MIVYDFNTKKLYIPDGIGCGCEGGGECSPEQLNKAYQSGYTNGTEIGYADGYDKGLDDGAEQQKILLSSITITTNGDYTREDGYNSINVNVPQTGHTDEELDEAWDNGYRVGFNDGADSVVCSGYTQADLDAAFASGWSAGYVSGYTDGGGTDYYLKLDGGTLYPSYHFSPRTTSLTGTIESNTTWVISGCPVWIDASQLAGAGNANVVFSPNSNTDGWIVAPPPASLGWARQERCTLKTTDDSISISITFIQETNVDPFNPPTPSGYTNQYLTFEVISGGTLKWASAIDDATYTKTIEYSINGGSWSAITSTYNGTPIDLNDGDVIRFRGNNTSYCTKISDTRFNSNFFRTPSYILKFKVYGNIMSLIYGDEFADKTSFPLNSNYNFLRLFSFNKGMVDASNLVLPATACTEGCYSWLFESCGINTSPELPATTLAKECYKYMFEGCSGLTTAPELHATTLVEKCYLNMFENCSNLNYIKCLATNKTTTDCTTNMTKGVAASGTFVKAAGTTWSTGNNGIPSGWTVEEE